MIKPMLKNVYARRRVLKSGAQLSVLLTEISGHYGKDAKIRTARERRGYK